MTGSKRIVDHTTFAELRWRRDPFIPDAFILPPGFQTTSHLLTDEFVGVLKDIRALQCIRDSAYFPAEDVMSMTQVDNHQTSSQSRLVSSAKKSSNIRSDYVVLLRLNHNSRFEGLYESWSELLEVLARFIWSEKTFCRR